MRRPARGIPLCTQLLNDDEFLLCTSFRHGHQPLLAVPGIVPVGSQNPPLTGGDLAIQGADPGNRLYSARRFEEAEGVFTEALCVWRGLASKEPELS